MGRQERIKDKSECPVFRFKIIWPENRTYFFYRGVGIMTEKQKSDIIGMNFSKISDSCHIRFKLNNTERCRKAGESDEQ